MGVYLLGYQADLWFRRVLVQSQHSRSIFLRVSVQVHAQYSYKYSCNPSITITLQPTMSVSEILSLQTTLSEALDAFRTEIAAQNLPEPSLNTPKPHAIDHPDYVPTPVMFEARRAALACLVCDFTFILSPYNSVPGLGTLGHIDSCSL